MWIKMNEQLVKVVINGLNGKNTHINPKKAVEGLNPVYANQTADVSKWHNLDVGESNRFNMFNASAGNAYGARKYQDDIARINTKLDLVGATTDSLDKIVENYRRGQYDEETLQAIAKSYGVTLNGSTPDEILRDFISKLGGQLDAQN